MFRGWGFLLGEIWVLILLAALLGLFVGWLIWGRRAEVVVDNEQLDRVRGELASARREKDQVSARVSALEADLAACRAQADVASGDADAGTGDVDASTELAACQSANAELEARIAGLQADLDAARAASGDASEASAEVARLQGELDACRSTCSDSEGRIAALEADLAECRASAAASATAAAAVAGPVAAAAEDEPDSPGERPAALDGPRGGQPDDLKRIKGIGPKLEKLCHTLGFYHFDQVAAWTDNEVAWVDHNLEGFKGRVTRDQWVDQAKVLANE